MAGVRRTEERRKGGRERDDIQGVSQCKPMRLSSKRQEGFLSSLFLFVILSSLPSLSSSKSKGGSEEARLVHRRLTEERASNVAPWYDTDMSDGEWRHRE